MQRGASRWGRKGPSKAGVPASDAYAAIDRILPVVAPLNLRYPVQISPPLEQGRLDGQPSSIRKNRMLRDSYTIDGGDCHNSEP